MVVQKRRVLPVPELVRRAVESASRPAGFSQQAAERVRRIVGNYAVQHAEAGIRDLELLRLIAQRELVKESMKGETPQFPDLLREMGALTRRITVRYEELDAKRARLKRRK